MSKTDNTKPLWLRRREVGATAYNRPRKIDYTDLDMDELRQVMDTEPSFTKHHNDEIGASRRVARFYKRKRAKQQRRSQNPQRAMSGRGWFRDNNYKYGD